MQNSISNLSKIWPERDLETVLACPVCQSLQRTLKHQTVCDWSFGTAPGVWSYWTCNDCSSLYLHPRPTTSSIGRAYTGYYTHKPVSVTGGFQGLKSRWKNERLSLRLDRNITPRFHLNGWFKSWAQQKAQRLSLAFGTEILVALSPGRFMDVGCGAGNIVSLASQLGWESEGIEIDPAAVKSAQQAGLNVNEGSYELLINHSQIFDVVLCSHVIEHVYDPYDLLMAIHSSLRPGGLLLLSTPNAQSDVHQFFGPYWRGLEAPRHLTVLNEPTLVKLLEKVGFEVISHADSRLETFKQSERIEKLATKNTPCDFKISKRDSSKLQRTEGGHDFIKLSARKL